MADYDLLDKSFDISKRKLRALEKLDKDLIKDTTVKMPMALSRIWDSVLLDSSSVKEDMAKVMYEGVKMINKDYKVNDAMIELKRAINDLYAYEYAGAKFREDIDRLNFSFDFQEKTKLRHVFYYPPTSEWCRKINMFFDVEYYSHSLILIGCYGLKSLDLGNEAVDYCNSIIRKFDDRAKSYISLLLESTFQYLYDHICLSELSKPNTVLNFLFGAYLVSDTILKNEVVSTKTAKIIKKLYDLSGVYPYVKTTWTLYENKFVGKYGEKYRVITKEKNGER
uniref:Uncharacterized protein n=1 Tax=viral metagenome TaxID=1070528 RepID=A0A6H1ZPI7_9ZZZZ